MFCAPFCTLVSGTWVVGGGIGEIAREFNTSVIAKPSGFPSLRGDGDTFGDAFTGANTGDAFITSCGLCTSTGLDFGWGGGVGTAVGCIGVVPFVLA